MANDKDFALVVGINCYPGFGNLNGAINDAKAFAGWLRNPNGGDLVPENIHLIALENCAEITEVLEAHPTVDDIEMFLRKIVQNAKDGWQGRRLYLFTAGHGIQPVASAVAKHAEGALLAANADTTTLKKHAPVTDYLNWFRAAGLFKEVVLFMDCCRDLAKNTPFVPVPWDQQKEFGKPSAFLIGLATQEGAKSRETEEQPGSGFHGIFTRTLLRGLNPETGSANAKGEITSRTLKQFVHNEIALLRETKPTMQVPVFVEDELDKPEIVFGKPGKSSMRPVKIHAMNGVNKVELWDGKNNLIHHLDLSVGDWNGTLEIGLYSLKVAGKAIIPPFEVLKEGVTEVAI